MRCSPWGHKESDTPERLHFHTLEKEMATHSSTLAWKIPWMEEPGALQSMGVAESATSLSFFQSSHQRTLFKTECAVVQA